MEKHEIEQILDYYGRGGEENRLNSGMGQLEFERSQEIIKRYLPETPCTIYDIGGGSGVYAFWLAHLGHQLHLIDLSDDNITIAQRLNQTTDFPLYAIEQGNALAINRPDNSADIVLLMGPLYHLPDKNQRLASLAEAKRVLKPNGILIAATINRYGNMCGGLATYGVTNEYLAEPEFIDMTLREVTDGQHIRHPNYAQFLARAYLHEPKEVAEEMGAVGLTPKTVLPVEGAGWLVPNFDQAWQNRMIRNHIMQLVKATETHESILGISPHMLGIGVKP